MNIAEMLSPLVAAYPNHPFPKETALLYAKMLADVDENSLKVAVLDHIAESNFFPTVADLRRRAKQDGNSAEREWLEVVRAFREGGPRILSEAGKAALDGIGGMSGLQYNGITPADRAHFFRLYEALSGEMERETRRQVIEAILDERKAIEGA